MKNKLVAQVYATTFLGVDKDQKMIEELEKFMQVLNSSNDLENVFFLEVFKREEKSAVFKGISEKMGFSSLFNNFISYLIDEKRINLVPIIYKEVIIAGEASKGVIKGTIEGKNDAVDQGILDKIKSFVETKIGQKTTLSYQQNKNVSAGFKITVGDYMLDATLDNQLDQFKRQVEIG